MSEFKKLMDELLKQCKHDVTVAHNTVGSLAYDYMHKKNPDAVKAAEHLAAAFELINKISIEDYLKAEQK